MDSRYMIDIISSISDAFGIKRAGNFPVPVGVEIVGEENDIFYLGPQLDKRLMRSDRLNIMSEKKYQKPQTQTSKIGIENKNNV